MACTYLGGPNSSWWHRTGQTIIVTIEISIKNDLHNDAQDEYLTKRRLGLTLIYQDVEKKGKEVDTEQAESRWNIKRKDDINGNIFNSDGEYLMQFTKVLIEIIGTRFHRLNKWPMEITGTITHLIKVLCKTIEDVIIAVDCVPEITQL